MSSAKWFVAKDAFEKKNIEALTSILHQLHPSELSNEDLVMAAHMASFIGDEALARAFFHSNRIGITKHAFRKSYKSSFNSI